MKILEHTHLRTKGRSALSTVEEAIHDIKMGKMVIVVDDEDRENEGDLIFAAVDVCADKINFLLEHARGLICAPITQEKAKNLNLELMVKNDDSLNKTAFTVSIDALTAGTGVSSKDRAETLLRLSSNTCVESDFIKPGHTFPLIANEGGILKRQGHTEASVQLVQWSGKGDTAVICEVINKDGTMARRDDLRKFIKIHNLKMISIEQMIQYKLSLGRKTIKQDCGSTSDIDTGHIFS